MNLPSELYYNPERKKLLVEELKQIHTAQMSAADTLDIKAINILNVTTATIGIVSAIIFSSGTGQINREILAGVVSILFLYSGLLYFVYCAIAPTDWRYVPGTEDGQVHYNSLLVKYISVDENEYFNRLIIDYVGTGIDEIGAIQFAKRNNELKSNYIKLAMIMLFLIIMLLIILSFLSI